MFTDKHIEAAAWLVFSAVLCTVATRLYSSAIMPRGTGICLAFSALAMGMFLQTGFGKPKKPAVKIKPAAPVHPDKLSGMKRIKRFFKSFEKAGIPFLKGADSRVADMVLEHFADEPTSMTIILECAAGLVYKHHLFHADIAAAHIDNAAEIAKARAMIPARPDKGVYFIKARYMILFARLNASQLIEINSRLMPYSLSFKPV